MSPARTPTPDNSAALVPSAWCALYESMAARFGDVAAAQQQPGIPPVRVLDKPLAITPPAVRRIVRPVKKLRAPVVSTLAALAAGCAFAPLASAQTIGVAATVRNDVAQVKGASALPISLGENVVRNKIVRTGADSSTKLVFVDDSNLAVGPVSTVTLDRFVFAGDSTYRQVTVNLVRGAFRFSTGSSDKRAYKINTPGATIGVRGTDLDIISERARTVVTLNDGAALVCTRSGGKCVTLSSPGDTAVVTLGGMSRNPPGRGFSFAQFCSGDAGLCTPTSFAALSPLSPATSVAALCGR